MMSYFSLIEATAEMTRQHTSCYDQGSQFQTTHMAFSIKVSSKWLLQNFSLFGILKAGWSTDSSRTPILLGAIMM